MPQSTDGHYRTWQCPLSRLNLNIVNLSIQHGGCIIVDSTRKGKAYPDSFNRTIPIWVGIINNTILQCKQKLQLDVNENEWKAFYVPSWISPSEKEQIEEKIPGFVKLILEVLGTFFFLNSQEFRTKF